MRRASRSPESSWRGDRAQAATSWSDYEACDDLFHKAVAEASDNALLVALFDHLNAVRRAVAGASVVRRTERPSEDHSSFAEHHRIAGAIEARDPAAAPRRHAAAHRFRVGAPVRGGLSEARPITRGSRRRGRRSRGTNNHSGGGES